MSVRGTRRWRGIAAAGLSVLTVGGAAVALDGSRSERSAPAAAVSRADGQAESQFYRDARVSLSPLLVHLSQQSQLFSQLLQDGASVSSGVAQLAEGWAGDAATARDLVRRLPAPPAARPAQALYRLAASLYVESGRTLAGAAGAPAPVDEVRAARRLQLLGDAVFDAGHRRLVPSTDDGTVPVERPPVGPLPDFAAAGLLAPAPAAVDVGVPEARARIERAAQEAAAWLTGGSAPGWDRQAVVATLRATSGGLGTAGTSVEDRVVRQLAALVEAEALRSPTPSEGAKRLHVLAAMLWSAAAPTGDGDPAMDDRFPLGGLGIELLDVGGVFNGHPPPLQPGDPPDKDVPGGLPSLSGMLTGLGG